MWPRIHSKWVTRARVLCAVRRAANVATHSFEGTSINCHSEERLCDEESHPVIPDAAEICRCGE